MGWDDKKTRVYKDNKKIFTNKSSGEQGNERKRERTRRLCMYDTIRYDITPYHTMQYDTIQCDKYNKNIVYVGWDGMIKTTTRGERDETRRDKYKQYIIRRYNKYIKFNTLLLLLLSFYIYILC